MASVNDAYVLESRNVLSMVAMATAINAMATICDFFMAD
jgi:hypothetical protein